MSGVNWEIRPDLDGGVATVHSDGVLHEVWWDTQDAGNPGYAYRTTGEMINESGPLDGPTLADAITEYEELVIAIDKAKGQKEKRHSDLDTIDLDHDLGTRYLTSPFGEED